MDLQGASVKVLLKSIPINSSTQPFLDEFVKQYITTNPKLLTDSIEKMGLYNVFFRECDTYSLRRGESEGQIQYIQSFATKTEAEEWIMTFGRRVVVEEEDNTEKPIVLTIIYCKNSEYEGEAGTEPAHLYQISGHRHPTYAFSIEGYEMLLREHKEIYLGNWCSDIVPYWIQYINEDNEIKYGCDLEHIKNIDKHLTYRDGDIQKERNIEEFQEFISNPIKYSRKNEKMAA